MEVPVMGVVYHGMWPLCIRHELCPGEGVCMEDVHLREVPTYMGDARLLWELPTYIR